MPVYDCGDPLCEACRREFGSDRHIAIAERNSRIENTPPIERYKRDREAIYDTISGAPVYFFATERCSDVHDPNGGCGEMSKDFYFWTVMFSLESIVALCCYGIGFLRGVRVVLSSKSETK